MATNVIRVSFGATRKVNTSPAYQWDYGQVLEINGAPNLPSVFQVHFSNQQSGGIATTVTGTNGKVMIPNHLLTTAKTVYAWIYVNAGDNDGETEYAIIIPVKARPMPEYYDVGDPGVFDDVVEQVREYYENADDAATKADGSATAAGQSATAAAGSATTAGNAAQTATDKAGEASASASAAAASETAAQTAQTGAETAATNAGQSASTATAKAAEAAQSASNAAASETAAEAAATRAETAAASLTVDDALSDVSENPVENRVITAEVTQVKSALDALKITDTASGAIASFPDGAAMPVESLTVEMNPIQSGSGDPSPDNVRPISGRDSVTVWREASYDPSADPALTIQLGDTVYGGTLDVVSGELVVDRAMVDLGTLNWISEASYASGQFRVRQEEIIPLNPKYSSVQCSILKGVNPKRYSSFNDGEIGLSNSPTSPILRARSETFIGKTVEEIKAIMQGQQLVYELATPITYHLTPQEVRTLLGTNNVWSDGDPVTVEYVADPKLYIDKKIAAAVAALA